MNKTMNAFPGGKMKKLAVLIVTGLLMVLSGCDSNDSSGISFNDLEQLEQSEQSELLALAEQSAGNWNFSSASSYLSQAQEKGYSPDAIDATKRVISKHRDAYRENERRKEEERQREEEQRRLAEAARQRQNSGGSSGGGSVDYVVVNFESVCGFALCSNKDVSMSGGPGSFTNNTGASGTLLKGYNGLAGTYSWVGSFDNKVCSGTVRVSGTKRNLTIRAYDNCNDAGTSEY